MIEAQISELIKTVPNDCESLSEYTNSDEYNAQVLKLCKAEARNMVNAGKYPTVIYGVRRFGVELKYSAPCLIPLTSEQESVSILDNAWILAIRATNNS
jgi:hypothetical protein